MKTPTDEEFFTHDGITLSPKNIAMWTAGAEWYRDQLKPLLSLVEQVREARKEYLACSIRDSQIAIALKKSNLEHLRDQLELGE